MNEEKVNVILDGGNFEIPKSQLNNFMREYPKAQLQSPTINEPSDPYYLRTAANFGKEVGSNLVAGIPDLASTVYNIGAWGAETANLAKDLPRAPYLSEKISKAIDEYTGGYTKPTNHVTENIGKFLGSLLGIGGAGKLIAKGGAALGNVAGNAIEKTGKGLQALGMTEASPKNIGAVAGAGGLVGAAQEYNMHPGIQIGGGVLGFILGGKAGEGARKLALKSLGAAEKEMPGLTQYLEKQEYSNLAKDIHVEDLQKLTQDAVLSKETEFLKETTLNKLPEELQNKIKSGIDLTDQEIDTVVKSGTEDYLDFIKKIEEESGFVHTPGELTGNPKIVAKEDYLANKANIDSFDKFTRNRRQKIVNKVQKIAEDISKNKPSSSQLGEKISKDIESIYDTARKLRKTNWNNVFKNVKEEPLIPINNYIEKLKEFSKLHPDHEGNIVAIKKSNERLKALKDPKRKNVLEEKDPEVQNRLKILWDSIPNSGLKESEKQSFLKGITPSRFNDILVGLTENVNKITEGTYSRSQIADLKSALLKDLDSAAQEATTSEQASLIKRARDGFREDSKFISELDDNLIFNQIDKGTLSVPEKVVKKLNSMEPSEINFIFKALRKSGKYEQTIKDIQRYYIEKALDKGMGPLQDIEQFNYRNFIKELPQKEAAEIIFGGEKSYQEIKKIVSQLKRAVKYEPTRSNSKTFQRIDAENEFGKSMIPETSVKGIVKQVTEKVKDKLPNTNKEIAEIILSPEKRDKIFKLIGKNANKNNKINLLEIKTEEPLIVSSKDYYDEATGTRVPGYNPKK